MNRLNETLAQSIKMSDCRQFLILFSSLFPLSIAASVSTVLTLQSIFYSIEPMPRNYYCHYCSVHIPNTRDSRSSHNLGSAHRSNVKRYYELIQLDQAGIVSHIPAQIDPVWGKYKKPKQLPDHGKLPPSLLPPPATSNLTPTYQWGDQHEYIHKVQSRLYN
ncbi:hypothetical protein RTP6_005327 [Batrachochytrium dendrobatidis]